MECQQNDNVLPERLDEQLKQLALTAQQYPLLSDIRRQASTKLICAILHSKKLWVPRRSQLDEEAYDEAKQNLWLYVYEEIEKYNPELGSVIVWVNMLLCKRFYREAKAKFIDKQVNKVVDIDSLLNNYVSPENSYSLINILWEYIELDPEEIFKKEHIEHHPEANFQALIKLQISGFSRKDISVEWKIKTSTLNSFYSRCLKKFNLNFKKYLR